MSSFRRPSNLTASLPDCILRQILSLVVTKGTDYVHLTETSTRVRSICYDIVRDTDFRKVMWDMHWKGWKMEMDCKERDMNTDFLRFLVMSGPLADEKRLDPLLLKLKSCVPRMVLFGIMRSLELTHWPTELLPVESLLRQLSLPDVRYKSIAGFGIIFRNFLLPSGFTFNMVMRQGTGSDLESTPHPHITGRIAGFPYEGSKEERSIAFRSVVMDSQVFLLFNGLFASDIYQFDSKDENHLIAKVGLLKAGQTFTMFKPLPHRDGDSFGTDDFTAYQGWTQEGDIEIVFSSGKDVRYHSCLILRQVAEIANPV